MWAHMTSHGAFLPKSSLYDRFKKSERLWSYPPFNNIFKRLCSQHCLRLSLPRALLNRVTALSNRTFLEHATTRGEYCRRASMLRSAAAPPVCIARFPGKSNLSPNLYCSSADTRRPRPVFRSFDEHR